MSGPAVELNRLIRRGKTNDLFWHQNTVDYINNAIRLIDIVCADAGYVTTFVDDVNVVHSVFLEG